MQETSTNVEPTRTTDAILAADVGGTHARLAMIPDSRKVADYAACETQTFRCADYPGLAAIVAAYLERVGAYWQVNSAAIAIAGVESDGVIKGTRLAWDVDVATVSEAIGGKRVTFVNDFLAAAVGSQVYCTKPSVVLQEGSVGGRTVVVLGPGTGFGAAAVSKTETGVQVMRSEAGQMPFAPTTDIQEQLSERYWQDAGSRPTNETFVSGGGLSLIYRLLGGLDGEARSSPAAVIDGARHRADTTAGRALSVFCSMLGGVCQALALGYYADGGVLIGGGIARRIVPELMDSDFMERFVSHESMQDFLRHLPVGLLDDDEYAIAGAAAAVAFGAGTLNS